jgi:NADH oxidase (H2O2-forming)
MTFIMDIAGHEAGTAGFTEEKAKNMGFDVTSVSHETLKTRPAYGGKPVYLKLIADRGTRTLLGAQILSQHEIGGMINELAVMFTNRIHLSDISQIDRPYSPLIGPDLTRRAIETLLAKLNK